jgi:hypothetical protein
MLEDYPSDAAARPGATYVDIYQEEKASPLHSERDLAEPGHGG